jgi:hypothetical protein
MKETVTSIRTLLDEVLAPGYPGVPVIVLFEDYRQREQWALALAKEAELHDVELRSFSRLSDALVGLPALAAARDNAALVLLDVSETVEWGRWLEANREKLPGWVLFLVVMVAREEFPGFVREAPAFLSWTKGRVIERLSAEDKQSSTDITVELEEMKRQTGLSPEEFVQSWREGKLQDTYRNSAWLNLAETALQTRKSGE